MANPSLEKFNSWLSAMGQLHASDLHLKVGSPPIYRVNTLPQKLKTDPLDGALLDEIREGLLTPVQKDTYLRDGAVDLSYALDGKGRFRLNIFQQRGACSFVARRVPFDVPPMENLGLPQSVSRVLDFDTGIILVVGMTGSGKTTTLASMIEKINTTRRSHIITIEDPIEFLYSDKKSFVSQREIGSDAPDFATAVRSALRQDPDIILVGEIRDQDTMATALTASETGHLVFGTLHATNVSQTIARVLDFFEGQQKAQARETLSNTLQAVMAQKLVPGAKPERPLVLVMELMLANPAIRKYLCEGEDAKIQECLRTMSKEGMQDFNMALHELVKSGAITPKVAFENSPNVEQLRMNLKGMNISTAQ